MGNSISYRLIKSIDGQCVYLAKCFELEYSPESIVGRVSLGVDDVGVYVNEVYTEDESIKNLLQSRNVRLVSRQKFILSTISGTEKAVLNDIIVYPEIISERLINNETVQ